MGDVYPDNMVEVHVRAYLYRWHTKDEHEVSGMNYEVCTGRRRRACLPVPAVHLSLARNSSWRADMLQRRPVRLLSGSAATRWLA